jgi:sugar phosphate isomerase/epimerase
MERREFAKRLIAGGAGVALGIGGARGSDGRGDDGGGGGDRVRLKLGFDNFSVRAWQWKAPRLLDYAAELGVDTVLFSDLHVFESLEESALREYKAKADALGVEVQIGTGGICPTSARLQREFGSPQKHLELLIRVARSMGSSAARCYLGSMGDREGEGGIYRHIDSTVDVLKKVRARALDAGVRIAVENHAGDLQAWELKMLIEEAGTDFVGATVDSGNATWALEDPVRNLEILAPYSVSSGIRDSMVWEDGDGARTQWTALGDGCVDLNSYFEIWRRVCPSTPVQLEIISGGNREFSYLKREFWKTYPRARAEDFAAYLALAKRGTRIARFEPAQDVNRDEAVRLYQRSELEKSVRYAKEVLNLGVRV